MHSPKPSPGINDQIFQTPSADPEINSVSEELVLIENTDWAASQVEAVPLHPSQTIIQRVDNAICVKLSVYETAELTSIFSKYGDFSWAG
jgi:hypothetical protein